MDSTDFVFRPAVPEEADALHQLTSRSTLSWGYEPAFLEWEPQALLVDAAFISSSHSFVLQMAGEIIGYYSITGTPPDSLDKLFVEPAWIGAGFGRILWDHAMKTAASLGIREMTFASDPHAVGFYRKMGAEWTGEEETTWPGWNLHFFRVDVPEQ